VREIKQLVQDFRYYLALKLLSFCCSWFYDIELSTVIAIFSSEESYT